MLLNFSLDPLKAYKNKTITLELPGDLTIFNIDWFSVFDHDTNTNLGSVIIPEALNVPPSLVKVIVSIRYFMFLVFFEQYLLIIYSPLL